jgi:hypothetical protein
VLLQSVVVVACGAQSDCGGLIRQQEERETELEGFVAFDEMSASWCPAVELRKLTKGEVASTRRWNNTAYYTKTPMTLSPNRMRTHGTHSATSSFSILAG